MPPLIRDRVDHGWSLWEELAKKAPDFGRPNTFYGNIDENKWESFTLTIHGDTLLNRIIEYTGNEPGTGALTTWIESGWHLSLVVPAQPHFPQQQENTYTLWGYGFENDNEGDYVTKKMSQATGTEILTELVHQLGFEDILEQVLATTDVTTVMMPYASALFSRRVPGDAPRWSPTALRTSRSSASSPSSLAMSCSPWSTRSTGPCTRCTSSSVSTGRSRPSTGACTTRRSE